MLLGFESCEVVLRPSKFENIALKGVIVELVLLVMLTVEFVEGVFFSASRCRA